MRADERERGRELCVCDWTGGMCDGRGVPVRAWVVEVRVRTGRRASQLATSTRRSDRSELGHEGIERDAVALVRLTLGHPPVAPRMRTRG